MQNIIFELDCKSLVECITARDVMHTELQEIKEKKQADLKLNKSTSIAIQLTSLTQHELTMQN